MSSAHLRVVPDPEPEPDDETWTPSWWPGPVLVPSPVPLDEEETDGHLESPPVDEDDEDLVDDEEPGEEDTEEEEPRGWLPDLRPYCDPRPLAELGPLAVEAGKKGGPPLLRGIGRLLRELGQMLAWYGRGIGVLLVLLAGWLSGKFGKRGSIGARFAGVGFAVYAVVKLSHEHQHAWIFFVVALLATFAMAASGHIEVPESKPAKKEEKGGKKGGETKKETPAKDAKDGPEEIAEVSKEDAPAAPRKGRLGRLLAAAKSPAEQSPADQEEGDEKEPEEVDEEAPEEAEEAPLSPSPEAVIRALHHLFAGGSGVLHTALAQHLGLADTRAAKRVLDEAGIPHRQGVRTPAGNGPGIHHQDFPPLPLAQGSPQGARVVPGQDANANTNNAANAPGEGLDAYRTRWTVEELARGFRSVPDPDRGPSASRIEYRRET